MSKDLNIREEAEKLAGLPFSIEVVIDETTDGKEIYIAKNLELEGCISQGQSRDEAVSNLSDARIDYIESLLEDNIIVPRPTQPKVFSITTTTGPNNSNPIIFWSQKDFMKGSKKPYEIKPLQYQGAISYES